TRLSGPGGGGVGGVGVHDHEFVHQWDAFDEFGAYSGHDLADGGFLVAGRDDQTDRGAAAVFEVGQQFRAPVEPLVRAALEASAGHRPLTGPTVSESRHPVRTRGHILAVISPSPRLAPRLDTCGSWVRTVRTVS